MKGKVRIITALAIVVLLILAALSVFFMQNRYDIAESIDDVKSQAEALYAQGNLEDAIVNLSTYCQYCVTDIDAKTTLGDWYMENGEDEKAYECYNSAAYNKKAEDAQISPLTIKNTQEVLLKSMDEYGIEITPDVRITKDMTLTITGYNLAPDSYEQGSIYEYEYPLTDEEGYKTTTWFNVNPEGSYLTLSGGFNCAIWQFMDKDGIITNYAQSGNTYRKKDSNSVSVYQMARVIIPEKTVKCRVTYYDESLHESTASPEERLTVVYGRLPGESRSTNSVTYKIPDLKEGEKITYKNGVWKMSDENGETVLSDWATPSLEKGSCVIINGTVLGRVTFDTSDLPKFDKDGIYTVRFDKNNPSNTGERLDDAKNLSFNGAVGEGFLSEGENDFDNIYPWSEIKLCAIKDGNIIYKGEEGFSDTGEAGDVFVEIPKFYTRRVVDENYDTISISGYCHDGFSVDEAFITGNGEADKIYIGAYITSVDDNGNMRSTSGSSPVLYMSPNDMKAKIQEKGEGYKAFDYAALSAVQKLFMVETGVRNSQCLYMGVCGFSIASLSEDESGYSVSVKSNTKTNCIDVNGDYTYNQGDNIVLFNTLNYDESYMSGINDIRVVKAVIENSDNTVSVFFTGEPVDVKENVTAIAHIAKDNGGADGIGYHTGARATTRGTLSFKYRYMENIWGNTHIYVDNIRVRNGVATLIDRYGETYTLSYKLPTDSYSKSVDTMIKTMGYDENHPGVMLPSVVGDGATSSTYYGDSYLHNDDNEEYTLHYGGGWNSAEGAGLFSYAALENETEGSMNASCRMIYFK